MATNFATLKNYYDTNQFTKLLNSPDGVYWLKLRSISRIEQLKKLCQLLEINCDDISRKGLLTYILP